MNHIVNIAESDQTAGTEQNRLTVRDYLTLAAMPLFGLLAYGQIGEYSSMLLLTVVSIIIYGLAIYIYYGTALLAWKKKSYLLWGAIVTAIVVSYASSGVNSTWQVLTGWSMFLFGGMIAGRLNLGALKPLHIYLAGIGAIVLFATAQNLMIWPEQIKMMREGIEILMSNSQANLISIGYTAEEITKLATMMHWTAGLLPAAALLSALLQFSLGYMLFLIQIDRVNPGSPRLAPFHLWKIPFAFTGIVLPALAVRFLKIDWLIQISDNILAIMIVFYCVTGLSLLKYFFLRMRIPVMVQFAVYLILAVTQIVGFIVTAALGFIDSFADWRNRQPAEVSQT